MGDSGCDVEKLAAPRFGVFRLLRLFVCPSFRQLVLAALRVFTRLKVSALGVLCVGRRGFARLSLLVAGARLLLCSHRGGLLRLCGLALYDGINQGNPSSLTNRKSVIKLLHLLS